MHSDRELGVSTAAMLHLAAASPSMIYAIDSHYHDQVDDIVTRPFIYEQGHLTVPMARGLVSNSTGNKSRNTTASTIPKVR